MSHGHKIHQDHLEHFMKEHDGSHAPNGYMHKHEAHEKHLKEHDGGMHGHKHHHEHVETMCGGGKA